MSVVNCSRAELVEWAGLKPCWPGAGWIYLLIMDRIRDSSTFAAGQRSEIGRYEVHREVSLPGFGIGMINEEFHIAGIWHVVMEVEDAVCSGQIPYYSYSSWLLSSLDPRWMSVPSPSISSLYPLLLIGSRLKKCSSQLWRVELLVANCLDDENEIPLKIIYSFSAINFFNGSPQLGDICLLVQGLNYISLFLPFVCIDAVLDVILQSWQFRQGGVSFTEVISSCYHIQYLCWYMFLVESVSSSRHMVWRCFE